MLINLRAAELQAHTLKHTALSAGSKSVDARMPEVGLITEPKQSKVLQGANSNQEDALLRG